MTKDPSPAKPATAGSSVSRRAVLRAGTLGAATLGAIGAVPGLLTDLVSAGPDVSGASVDLTGDASAAEEVAAAQSAPIVAHITDASTGEVSVFVGEREITYRDTQLVQRLLRAAR